MTKTGTKTILYDPSTCFLITVTIILYIACALDSFSQKTLSIPSCCVSVDTYHDYLFRDKPVPYSRPNGTYTIKSPAKETPSSALPTPYIVINSKHGEDEICAQ